MSTIRDQVRLAMREDGKDHINLSYQGKTVMGQKASMELRRRFFIPHLGEFESPRNFANWMVSCGDDALRYGRARYDIGDTPVYLFRWCMLYAKYYQVLSMRNTFIDHKDQLNLNWTSYKQHLTGIREYDRWEEYPSIVKMMVRHVVSNEPSVQFDWACINPQMLSVMSNRIRQIAEASGTLTEDVVDITKADEVARERKEQAAKANAQRLNRRREVPPMTFVETPQPDAAQASEADAQAQPTQETTANEAESSETAAS